MRVIVIIARSLTYVIQTRFIRYGSRNTQLEGDETNINCLRKISRGVANNLFIHSFIFHLIVINFYFKINISNHLTYLLFNQRGQSFEREQRNFFCFKFHIMFDIHKSSDRCLCSILIQHKHAGRDNILLFSPRYECSSYQCGERAREKEKNIYNLAHSCLSQTSK